MMKKLFPLRLVILLFIIPLNAQTAGTAGEGKGPSANLAVPANLTVSGGAAQISLVWESSPGLESRGWEVYRFTSPINHENFSSAERIAVLPAGDMKYTDAPPSQDTVYYYAVLALNSQGIRQEVFVPLANTSLNGASALYTSGPNETREISRLTARAYAGSVVLSFLPPEEKRELLVYRSTSPILSARNLLSALLIDTIAPEKNEYTDYPIPGVGYYYAVIDSTALRSGQIRLTAGKNTTDYPVLVSFAENPEAPGTSNLVRRPRPLPQLASSGIYSSAFQKEASPLSPEARDAVDKLMNTLDERPLPALKPYILPSDRPDRTTEKEVKEAPGQDSRFTAIINKEFAEGHYETALEMLLLYRQLPRSREMQYKLHFYIGQAYFFLQDQRNALLEFLFAEEVYYAETRPFLNYLYRL